MGRSYNAVTPEQFDAAIFDLDGVLTEAAKVQAACWEKMFDAFLPNRLRRAEKPSALSIVTRITNSIWMAGSTRGFTAFRRYPGKQRQHSRLPMTAQINCCPDLPKESWRRRYDISRP